MEHDKTRPKPTYVLVAYYLHTQGGNHLYGNYDHSHIYKDLNVNHDHNGLDNDNDD